MFKDGWYPDPIEDFPARVFRGAAMFLSFGDIPKIKFIGLVQQIQLLVCKN
jgi:hypothetical protein